MSLLEQTSEVEDTHTSWTLADHLYGDDDEFFLRHATPFSPVPKWRLKTIIKDLEDGEDLLLALPPAEQPFSLWRDNGVLTPDTDPPTGEYSRPREQIVRDDRLSVQYNVAGVRPNEIAVIGKSQQNKNLKYSAKIEINSLYI